MKYLFLFDGLFFLQLMFTTVKKLSGHNQGNLPQTQNLL